MRFTLLATLCCISSPALAMAPWACETDDPVVVLTIAGPIAQIRTADTPQTFDLTPLPQPHDGFPHSWHMTLDDHALSLTVDEAACSTKYGSFPLRFYLVDHAKPGSMLHGCCTVAE